MGTEQSFVESGAVVLHVQLGAQTGKKLAAEWRVP